MTFEPSFVAALVSPAYAMLVASMPDAADILGEPDAVYVGPAGVNWELRPPPASLLGSPLAVLPWQVYEHSDCRGLRDEVPQPRRRWPAPCESCRAPTGCPCMISCPVLAVQRAVDAVFRCPACGRGNTTSVVA